MAEICQKDGQEHMIPIEAHRVIAIRTLVFKSNIILTWRLRQEAVNAILSVSSIALISVIVIETLQAVSRGFTRSKARVDLPLSLSFLQ